MKSYVNITNWKPEKGHGGAGDYTYPASLMCNEFTKWDYDV